MVVKRRQPNPKRNYLSSLALPGTWLETNFSRLAILRL